MTKKDTPTPYFSIEVIGEVIWIKLVGAWSVPIDLKYMTQLSQVMAKMRKKSWSMIVDMRNWDVKETPKEDLSPEMANIQLDRRNQILEAWWIRDKDQANFLVPFVAQDRSMQFIRSTDFSDIQAALESKKIKTHMPTSWQE
jgi:hypothetical protein